MGLINFTAKCQAVDIHQQFYKYGATVFDLRVKFDKRTNEPIIAHGLVEYGCAHEMIQALKEFSRLKNIYCKVLLEDGFMSKKERDRQTELYKDFCKTLEEQDSSLLLHFIGGQRKSDYSTVYSFKGESIPLYGVHASMSKNKLVHLWPWLYAKKHNKDSYKQKVEGALMFDFIEIGHEQNK